MRALVVLIALTACGGAPSPAPRAPTPPSAETRDPVEPTPSASADAPAGPEVPPAPAECRSFLDAVADCATTPASLEDIAAAVEIDDPRARDRRLVCVEQRAANGASLVRALRAELGPLPCADVLVVDFIERSGSNAKTDTNQDVLLGLMIAAQLSRLLGTPPALAPPFDKPRFFAFFEQELKPWIVEQARAIGALSQRASRLTGYGKAIGAVEAGVADLRFVQVVRGVPLPAELASDREVKDAYYAALDEALEPRKARGRDAALVALRHFAELGALHDPRVDRARKLLSELYAGSRIDALDRLLLPELPPLSLSSPLHRLASKLPTYYAAHLLRELPQPDEPALLRAFLERGLPASLRAALDARTLGAEARYLYAHAEAQRGIVYFSGPAFVHARQIIGSVPNDAGTRLLSALSEALSAAPKDAADMMLSGPRMQRALGPLESLDALAATKNRYRGEAEFDAAYLRSLTPPGNDAAFWQDLERRFRRAEKGLTQASARAFARELADSARATAKAVQKP